jgi:cereblon
VGSSHSSAGGSKVTLPMFYLEGIVLFPEEKLPLRVLQPRFKAAVVRAMQQEDNEAPYTLGVIHVRAKPQDRGIIVASVGTTAEVVAQSPSTCIATFTLCFLQCQELDYSCIV